MKINGATNRPEIRRFFSSRITMLLPALSLLTCISFSISPLVVTAGEGKASELKLEQTTVRDLSPYCSIEEFDELSALTLKEIHEFKRLHEFGNRYGYEFAIFGGTSRELLHYVKSKIVQLNSASAYRSWLQGHPRIHLFDFHRAMSDLDIMFVPPKPSEPTTETEIKIEKELQDLVKKELPGNLFYDKIDPYLPYDFYSKFDPKHDHIEAVSSIILTSKGVVRNLQQLNIQVKGQSRFLPPWGIDQIFKGYYEFRLADQFYNDATLRKDHYRHVRQYLRWLRYLAESPEFKLTSESLAALKEMRDFLNAPENKSETLNKIKDPKIQKAVEKLQIYARDSDYTQALLKEWMVADWAKEAGVGAIILNPLKNRTSADLNKITQLQNAGTLKTLGDVTQNKERVFYHRSKLSAVQNISNGALWKSDPSTMINGRSMMSAMTDSGLYAGQAYTSSSYGQFAVAITLSPSAVQGVDYVGSEINWIAIRTKEAIAKDQKGHLKIQKLEMQDLLDTLVQQIKYEGEGALAMQEKAYNVRTLAAILYPESDSHDLKIFHEIWPIIEKLNLQQAFADAYFTKDGVVETYLNSVTLFHGIASVDLAKLFTSYVERRRGQSTVIPLFLALFGDRMDRPHEVVSDPMTLQSLVENLIKTNYYSFDDFDKKVLTGIINSSRFKKYPELRTNIIIGMIYSRIARGDQSYILLKDLNLSPMALSDQLLFKRLKELSTKNEFLRGEMLAFLLASESPVLKEYGSSLLKKQKGDFFIFAIQQMSLYGSGWMFGGFNQELKVAIKNELKNNKAVRARYLKKLNRYSALSYAFLRFPWDLSNKAELELYKGLLNKIPTSSLLYKPDSAFFQNQRDLANHLVNTKEATNLWLQSPVTKQWILSILMSKNGWNNSIAHQFLKMQLDFLYTKNQANHWTKEEKERFEFFMSNLDINIKFTLIHQLNAENKLSSSKKILLWDLAEGQSSALLSLVLKNQDWSEDIERIYLKMDTSERTRFDHSLAKAFQDIEITNPDTDTKTHDQINKTYAPYRMFRFARILFNSSMGAPNAGGYPKGLGPLIGQKETRDGYNYQNKIQEAQRLVTCAMALEPAKK